MSNSPLPEERPRLWELMAKTFPKYDEYATETTRGIPVVVLEPSGGWPRPEGRSRRLARRQGAPR
ncbi:nitroreductase/quinone reductase family protein [Micromonospora rubida]